MVAAGGDGTVHEVASGLLDARRDGHDGTALALMPLGTMNVFAMELGLPVRNVRACWRAAVEGETRNVDCWSTNGTPLVQLGGIGLDAAVVAETSWEFKRRMGAFSYLANAARILARPAPRLRIEVDGECLDGALVLFGNGEHYGGPIKAFPGARLDDGWLHVLVLRRQTTVDVLGFLAALATGTVESFSGADLLRGREVHVTSARPVPFEVDGEHVGETPVTLVSGGAPLRVCVPGD